MAEMTKHTPGPWDWYWEDSSMAILCGYSDGQLYPMVKHVTTVSICSSCAKRARAGWQWGRCTSGTAANARLIAAAPDLLAALSDLVQAISNGDAVEGHASVGRARDAIAKATGREGGK